MLLMARESTSQVTNSSRPPSIKSIMAKSLCEQHNDYWNSSLDHLTVQSKFKDIIDLEPESRTWNGLLAGLPSGQLSFLI